MYTSAHTPYPSADEPAVHLFFPSFFHHFAGNDTRGGPPDGRSNDGLLDTRLLVSHDAATGNLSYAADGDRGSFVSLGVNRCGGWTPGQQGGWCDPTDGSLGRTDRDTSTVWMAAGYIPDGEVLHMYYTGWPHTHGGGAGASGVKTWGNNTGIGLLTLRTDGFVAVEAPYDFGTPRPSFATTAVDVPAGGCSNNSHPKLLVNMVTGVAGYVAIAVEAADGQPPPSAGPLFGRARANLLKGNAIAAVASWAQGGDATMVSSLRPWAGREIRFRVEMVDARLFSLRVTCI